jgi:hypothetical protein
MARIAAHSSVDALRERYVSSSSAREARHFHTIWLLAKSHTIGEVAEMTCFGRRWIEQLAARYNAKAPNLSETCADATALRRECRSPSCSTSGVFG